MSELGRLWRLARPQRGWMLVGVMLALMTVLANIGLLAVAGWFITSMAIAGAAAVSFNYFTPAAIIRGLAITRTGGRWLERVITHEATLRLLSGLRVWFYQHLEPLAPAGLEDQHSGDLMGRMRADIDALDGAYLSVFVPLATAALGVTIVTATMAIWGLDLALINLALLLVAGLLLPAWIQARATRPGADLVRSRSQLQRALIDGVQGLPELLVYARADDQAARIDAIGRVLNASQRRMSGLRGLSNAALGLCANVALLLVLVVAIPKLQQGLDPAALTMLALLALASFETIAPLPEAMRVLGELRPAAARLFEIVDRRAPITEPQQPSPQPDGYDLQLRGIRLRYQSNPAWALDGLDLDLASGQHIAIVGASGAGKSSLVNLLLRFADYQHGDACFGGHALRSYHSNDLRQHFAVVSQHSHLFNSSVRANLLLADPQADEARLFAALERAQALDFVSQLPDGLDSFVGEAGTRLSGGQARRLVVARALLKDAPILVLDEPTEGLDNVTADGLMATLKTAMRGRSVILISHRPAALTGMDQVFRMQDGRLVEQGMARPN